MMKGTTNHLFYRSIPLLLFFIFFCFSALYVVFFYQPSIDMQINDGSLIKVTSKEQAEVEVYSQLPYQTTIQTNEGNQILVDTRLLGLSYFSQKNIDVLNQVSGVNLSNRIKQFFDLSFQNRITIYSDQLYLHGRIEDTLNQYPNLIKKEPIQEHLIVDQLGQLVVKPASPGFLMQPENFIAVIKEIEANGDFSERYVESELLYPTEAEPLSHYQNLIGLKQFQFSSNVTMLQNIRTGYYSIQNVFIPANATVSITDLIGPVDISRGFIAMEDSKGNSKIGVGIDELVDAFALAASENDTVLSITRYKGEVFSVGNVDNLERVLELKNNTNQDLVISSILDEDQFLIIIAKK